MTEAPDIKTLLAEKRRLWELPDGDLRVCFTEREFNALEAHVRALEAERDRMREAALALANAADEVGVEYFDTDTMDPLVEAMQQATLVVRAALNLGGQSDE